MKLNEIMAPDMDGIHEVMAGLNIDEGKYTISPDGSVNLAVDSLDLDDDDLVDGRLPVRIGQMSGHLHYSGHLHLLESFENFPRILSGNLYVESKNIDSFEGFPKVVIGDIDLDLPSTYSFNELDLEVRPSGGLISVTINNNAKSLLGIENHIKFAGSVTLALSFQKITKGGIGLILMPGLHTLADCTKRYTLELPPAFEIIAKYLGRPNDIFECQAELIAAGFEAFAQL